MNNLLDQLHAALLSRNVAEIIKIAEQIDGECQGGKIIELPCKVGNTVYWASLWGNEISQGEIKEIKISKFGIDLTMLTPNEITVRREFERTFSTYEAAEQALKERDT